ncbi:MAG TPA: hypothetical protein PKZ02_01265 [Candidatus Paceibacterota bacterium]|nr:hypothetical protein [Candidatus Paceibacterota bacterium]
MSKNGNGSNGKNGFDAKSQALLKQFREGDISLNELVKELPLKFKSRATIELLEGREISLEDFLGNMVPNLKKKWDIIFNLLKELRVIRNKQVAEKLTLKRPVPYSALNSARGLLSKFVEWGALTQTKSPDGKHHIYLCNLPEFYSLEELLSLNPEHNKVKIFKAFTHNWNFVDEIAKASQMSPEFLKELLNAYVSEGLLKKKQGKKGDKYGLHGGLKEMGISAESIKAFDIIRSNNELEQQEEAEAMNREFKSLEELAAIQKEDLEKKTVKTKELSVDSDSLKLVFLGELALGHQFSDVHLINYFLPKLEKINPNFVISSDFVQGDFRGIQVDRLRTLTRVGRLNKVAAQYKAADLVLQKLEKVARQEVFYQLSDDDYQISVSRALIAMEQYRGMRKSGLGSLFPEEIKRLSGEDFRRFMKFQWKVIQPYMYRIGRALLNANEVESIIGDKHSEYLLIVFILLFERRGIPIPDKWKLVVDMEALHGDKKKSKRLVTPDPISLRLPERFGNKEILVVHNNGFSPVTMYLNSLMIPETVIRQLQMRGEETPFLMVDFHQERFCGTKVGKTIQGKNDTYIFNLPGCKDTILDASNRIKSFNSMNILTDKVHRQNTFRKEPSTSGITCFEIFPDGRIKFRLLTHKMERVLEAQKDKPEERELLAILQDLQIGSIQMRPEWDVKALDYALYTRKASIVDFNGDIIQGINYKQTYSENRPKRLVSVRSQQAFTRKLLLPFFPAPSVKKVRMRVGNHEWNTFGTAEAGQNNLVFFADALADFHLGKGQPLDVICYSRILFKNSANPGGATVNWPYSSEEVAGFRYAAQHKWSMKEGGGAVNTMAQWATRMAGCVGDVDLFIAGHKHIFATALIAEKLFLQLPGLIDQSGYEMAGGFMPQSLFTLIEFSNREGITVELIPVEFLEKYKCVSPAYKDIDAQGLLDRPKPGTRDHQFGLDSLFIRRLEEETDSFYTEV